MRLGVVWTFFLSSITSLFFLPPTLWETARYRLKYCLKGPLSLKQPTNQPILGKLPVQGRPTIRIIVGQGPTALAVGAGGGCLDIFFSCLSSLFLLPLSGLVGCFWPFDAVFQSISGCPKERKKEERNDR